MSKKKTRYAPLALAIDAAGGKVIDLADALGVHQANVSMWNKRRSIPPWAAFRINELYGIDLWMLRPDIDQWVWVDDQEAA